MFRVFAIVLCLVVTLPAQQAPKVLVGTPAPLFMSSDDEGMSRSLADFTGRFVVLEWHEKGCPYVTKHYRGGHMQALQKTWMDRDVVWLLVNSSAEGFHSYLEPDESREYRAGLKTTPTAMLLDPAGTVGKLYGVATALHMVIIDPAGIVAYNGAIDDQPKTEAASLAGAMNYVDAALTALLAGRAPATATSTPYGCEVHYRGITPAG